jgi:hypothetical protein
MKTVTVVVLFAAVACSSGQAGAPPAAGAPAIQSFEAASPDVFVGEAAQLTAVFDGDSASIDGIGAVQSGIAVTTPQLSRKTTFTLRVARGGQEITATTDVQASYRNRIRALADAPFAQHDHVAAALPDGGALVMGGNTSRAINVPDDTLSQSFDPSTERFTAGPELAHSAEAGFFTTIAPLGGGFLLAGTGVNANEVGNAKSVATQVFDPASGFKRVGDVVSKNIANRTAVSLLDGGVLLIGGSGPQVIPVVSTDRFNATTLEWRQAGALGHVRVGHTATLLHDGRVLVAGGITCCKAGNVPEFFASSAEIYDPATDSFTDTGSMAAPRGLHAAALLADGRVLVMGGAADDELSPPLTAEIYDPVTGQFSPAGSLQVPRDSHAAVTLTDGRVLVIGGEQSPGLAGQSEVGVPTTEIYDPAIGHWTAGPTFEHAFAGATVTLLANGKVLVFGGSDAGGFPVAAAALFE